MEEKEEETIGNVFMTQGYGTIGCQEELPLKTKNIMRSLGIHISYR